MQYTVRTMLLFTAIIAIGAWLWPKDSPARVQVLAGGLTTGLAATAICAIPAYQIYRKRAPPVGAKRVLRQMNHDGALIAGLLGILPPAALLLMWPLDPYEHAHRVVHGIMVLASYFAFISVIPITVFLLFSLIFFWGFRTNLPLLIMRLTALVTNLAWPVYFYFVILPRLG